MDDSLTLLVDAPSLIYRALFSTPDTIRTPQDRPINAAYGFLSMLARLIEARDPQYLCCAFDEDWRPAWRVELIESYKAHRAEVGSPQEEAEDRLAPQMPVILAILELAGVAAIGFPEAEAEDVIGTLAVRAPGRVAIFSGDRDLFQLVEDPKIVVLFPRRGVGELDVVDEAFIEEKFGIPGRAYRDYAVLRGDPSDGLPGVRGIGDKLARGLVSRYGGIEGILRAIEDDHQSVVLTKVRRDLDYVERAVKVVSISTDLPLPPADLTRRRSDPDPRLTELARQNGLTGPVRRLVAALRGASSA